MGDTNPDGEGKRKRDERCCLRTHSCFRIPTITPTPVIHLVIHQLPSPSSALRFLVRFHIAHPPSFPSLSHARTPFSVHSSFFSPLVLLHTKTKRDERRDDDEVPPLHLLQTFPLFTPAFLPSSSACSSLALSLSFLLHLFSLPPHCLGFLSSSRSR